MRLRLEEAISRYVAAPEIFNTDQGSQFTAASFIDVLQRNKIRISMDGRGAWRYNVFIERLWKTVKSRNGAPCAAIDRRWAR